MRKLKVWGGLTFRGGKQVRTIIAATTKKRIMEIGRLSIYELNNYWAETGNEVELETAIIEGIWISTDDWKVGPYTRIG